MVADGANGAKIGTATDNGLYFQFGSLVGWSETGNPTIAVSPVGYAGSTSWNKDWTGDPTTENVATGTGDPCKYYLKGTWRLPTKDEYVKLFENNGYPSTGPWKWDNTSQSATHTSGLTFLASGDRDFDNGKLRFVGAYGSISSSSPKSDIHGYTLYFDPTMVISNNFDMRATGVSVRCIRNASN